MVGIFGVHADLIGQMELKVVWYRVSQKFQSPSGTPLPKMFRVAPTPRRG